jgi:dTDP-4-dehydrorhamnose reductase
MSNGILLFGAAGQVGSELIERARERGISVRGITRVEADLADRNAVEAVVASSGPQVVVNAAAYTAVDQAEREQEAAHASNVLGARNIAESARRHDLPLIHLSTDYVFDGSKAGAYVEDDPIAPLGVYGRTKAEGEQMIRDSGVGHVILRTSWVYGRHGKNFVRTMLRLAQTQDVIRVVADQRGCPTATADIAEAIFAVCDALRRGGDRAPLPGTFHFAGTGATTWHGLALAAIEAQAELTGKRPRVEAIGTRDYPTPARRPANSELDSSRFFAAFGYRAKPWRERVREVVTALCSGSVVT